LMILLPELGVAATGVWLVERVRFLEQVVSSCVAKLDVCVRAASGDLGKN